MQDGRKKFCDIAKEASLSTDAICKRFKGLEKSGIIVGSTILFDYKSYGHNIVADFTLEVDPNIKEVQKLIKNIKKLPKVLGVFPEEYQTIKVVVSLKEVEDLNRLIDVMSRLPYVLKVRTNIWTGIKNIPENLSVFDPTKLTKSISVNRDNFENKKKKTNRKMDEIDKKIIDALSIDGRKPISLVSKSIGIPTVTIIRRYQRMKNLGLIKFVQQINPKKLGYKGVLKMKMSFISKISSKQLLNQIIAIPDVIIIIRTSGDQDLEIVALVKTITDQISIRKKVEAIGNILDMVYILEEPIDMLPFPREQISNFWSIRNYTFKDYSSSNSP